MSTEVKPTDWDAEDNMWKPTPSGGGSGLPAYTSSDIGKVLTVGEAEPVETVAIIVPEQSVEMTFGRRGDPSDVYYVNGADWSDVSVGDTITLVFDGVEREATVTSDAYFSLLAQVTDGTVTTVTYSFGVHEGETEVSLSPHGPGTFTFTVSLKKVTSVTPSVQTVIVPEQTIALTKGHGTVVGADEDFFANAHGGDSISAVINGESMTMVGADPGGTGVVAFKSPDATMQLGLFDGSVIFYTDAALESVTISATSSVPSVEPKWEAASGGGIVDIAVGTRTAANGADNAIYVNGQELTTLEECATYLESVKNNVLRVYINDIPAGVTSFSTVTNLIVYRAGNMAYGEFIQKLPQTGEINVRTFGYMPPSD